MMSEEGSNKETGARWERRPTESTAKVKAAGRGKGGKGELSRQRQCVREEEFSDEKERGQVENAISSHLKLIRHTAVKLR